MEPNTFKNTRWTGSAWPGQLITSLDEIGCTTSTQPVKVRIDFPTLTAVKDRAQLDKFRSRVDRQQGQGRKNPRMNHNYQPQRAMTYPEGRRSGGFPQVVRGKGRCRDQCPRQSDLLIQQSCHNLSQETTALCDSVAHLQISASLNDCGNGDVLDLVANHVCAENIGKPTTFKEWKPQSDHKQLMKRSESRVSGTSDVSPHSLRKASLYRDQTAVPCHLTPCNALQAPFSNLVTIIQRSNSKDFCRSPQAASSHRKHHTTPVLSSSHSLQNIEREYKLKFEQLDSVTLRLPSFKSDLNKRPNISPTCKFIHNSIHTITDFSEPFDATTFDFEADIIPVTQFDDGELIELLQEHPINSTATTSPASQNLNEPNEISFPIPTSILAVRKRSQDIPDLAPRTSQEHNRPHETTTQSPQQDLIKVQVFATEDLETYYSEILSKHKNKRKRKPSSPSFPLTPAIEHMPSDDAETITIPTKKARIASGTVYADATTGSTLRRSKRLAARKQSQLQTT